MGIYMKKIISSLLLTILVLSMLFSVMSCTKINGNKDTTVPSTTETPDTSLPTDSNGYLLDNLPNDLNFNSTYTILGWKTSRDEFYVEKTTGDTINDAIFNRNAAVESRLGVTLEYNIIDGDNSKQTEFVQAAVTSIKSSAGAYDSIGCYSMCGGTLATQGAILNLLEQDYLDFDMPWWSESMVDLSTINGKMYFASGDISDEFLYNLMFLIFNTQMIDDLNLNDPRNMTLDGTWTLDELFSMSAGAYSNLDSDPSKSMGDQFGLIIPNQVHIDAFFSGCGLRISEPNTENLIQLSDDFTGDKTYDLIVDLCKFLYVSNDAAYYTNGFSIINEGRTLFASVQGSTLTTMRDIDWEYGIVPYPKADTSQDNYYTNLGFAYTNHCIPNDAKNPAMSAAVIECLASEAYRKTSPAIFDTTFKYKYSNNPLDAQMFDIIKSNIFIDSARIFSSSFVWAQSPVSLFRSCIMNNNTSWASTISGQKDYINNIFKTISENLG